MAGGFVLTRERRGWLGCIGVRVFAIEQILPIRYAMLSALPDFVPQGDESQRPRAAYLLFCFFQHSAAFSLNTCS